MHTIDYCVRFNRTWSMPLFLGYSSSGFHLLRGQNCGTSQYQPDLFLFLNCPFINFKIIKTQMFQLRCLRQSWPYTNYSIFMGFVCHLNPQQLLLVYFIVSQILVLSRPAEGKYRNCFGRMKFILHICSCTTKVDKTISDELICH